MSKAGGSGPAKPFGNSYWVKPGKLLAGEHPNGRTRAETTARIQALAALGIDTFIDLTRPREVSDYSKLLPKEVDGKAVKHLRFAIRDHDVPSSPQLVCEALDAIGAALAQGSHVYVHCRAGIGRTGTIIGCFLAREGHSAESALAALNALWRSCDRARSWHTVPETPEQVAYVSEWREAIKTPVAPVAPPMGAVEPLSRYQGTLQGLAAGDLLGGGTGNCGADTAMSCCVAESLLRAGGVDAEDQMRQYLRWQRGELFSQGQAPVMPAEVRRAVAAWLWSRKPLAGSHDPANQDPHPLARTAAVALHYAHEPAVAIAAAAETARPTLQSPLVLDACKVFAALLVDALAGTSKTQLLRAQGAACDELRRQPLKPPLAALLNGDWRRMPAHADIVAVLAAAWRHFAEADTLHTGMSAAVKGAPLPATAGAVYGALAGAHFGSGAIPAEWRDKAASPWLAQLVIGLFEAANKK